MHDILADFQAVEGLCEGATLTGAGDSGFGNFDVVDDFVGHEKTPVVVAFRQLRFVCRLSLRHELNYTHRLLVCKLFL